MWKGKWEYCTKAMSGSEVIRNNKTCAPVQSAPGGSGYSGRMMVRDNSWAEVMRKAAAAGHRTVLSAPFYLYAPLAIVNCQRACVWSGARLCAQACRVSSTLFVPRLDHLAAITRTTVRISLKIGRSSTRSSRPRGTPPRPTAAFSPSRIAKPPWQESRLACGRSGWMGRTSPRASGHGRRRWPNEVGLHRAPCRLMIFVAGSTRLAASLSGGGFHRNRWWTVGSSSTRTGRCAPGEGWRCLARRSPGASRGSRGALPTSEWCTGRTSG